MHAVCVAPRLSKRKPHFSTECERSFVDPRRRAPVRVQVHTSRMPSSTYCPPPAALRARPRPQPRVGALTSDPRRRLRARGRQDAASTRAALTFALVLAVRQPCTRWPSAG
eukprot:351571-Chlamydomonas_euryale.AAC.4